jgi:hypothetical protein
MRSDDSVMIDYREIICPIALAETPIRTDRAGS